MRLINKAAEYNIEILNLENHYKGKFYIGCIHIKNLSFLNQLAQKNNCNIEIISKNIYDTFVNNIKYRLIFIVGFFIYLFVIYICSSLVWIIDIEGNHNIEDSDILKFCNNNNLYVGCFLDSIDGNHLSDNIKNEFKNISWINVSTKGTRVYIKMAEGSDNGITENENTPCNIVAKSDGIISDIITDKGTPIVKTNDVVSTGDILISGILKNSGNEEIVINDLVQAKGTVKAIVTKNYSFSIPLLTQKKNYTGEETTKFRIKLWTLDFADNNDIKYKNYDYVKNVNQLKLNDSIPLPITVYRYLYKEYNITSEIISQDKAKNIANQKLLEYILTNYPTTSDIISSKLDFKLENNILKCNATIISNEEIGEQQNIEQSGGNLFNDSTETTNTR